MEIDRELDKEKSHPHAIKLYEKGVPLKRSLGIDENDTYGYGKLDDYGFWAYPIFFKK
jgi:hypothetical protein